MTGPAARGTERGTRAPSRVTGTQGAVGAVLVVLALGLALRLIIAYLLPGSGFGVDLGAFRAWAANLASQGLNGFYQRDFFHDYTPGLPVRAVGARARRAGHRWGRCRPHQGAGDPRRPGHRLARLVDGPRARRPATSFALGGGRSSRSSTRSAGSTAWSGARSTRSVSSSCCSACASCGATTRSDRRSSRSSPRSSSRSSGSSSRSWRWSRSGGRSGRPAGGDPRPTRRVADAARPTPAAWERRTDHPIRILTTGLVACRPSSVPPLRAVGHRVQADGAVLLLRPAVADLRDGLGLSVPDRQRVQPVGPRAGRHRQQPRQFGAVGLRRAVDGHRWLRRRASRRSGRSRRSSSGGADARGDPGRLVVAARRPDRLTILVGLAVLAIAFYVVPTRVHERYAYPVFALAIILAAIAWRWRLAYVALTSTFLNMYAALTNPFYDNPGISDWLGIGPTIRGEVGVTFIALVNGAIFLWALAQLRPSALARLTRSWRRAADAEDEDDDGRRGRRGPRRRRAAAVAGGAAVGDRARDRRRRRPRPPLAHAPPATRRRRGRRRRDGVLDAAPDRSTRSASSAGSRRASTRPPVRPDRSATLRHEGGGRLDRLDLFLLVLLILGDDAPAHVPAGRAVPDALRRGLSRADRHRVPPGLALRHLARHLRMDPSARRQVPDGRRPRGVRDDDGQCHERSRASRSSAAAVEPRRLDERRRADAPASACTSRPGPRSGPTTSRRATWSRPSPAPGRHRPGDRRDRQPARHRLRRRTDRHARPRPDRRGGVEAASSRRRAGDAWTTRSTTCWSPTTARSLGRIVRPADDHQPRRGDRPRHRSTCRASPTSRRAGPAPP